MSYVIKNTAACGATATTRTIQQQCYVSHRPASIPFRKIPPGRPDHRVALPPTSAPRQAAPPDGVPLGLLVLALQDCTLPPYQERRAWGG